MQKRFTDLAGYSPDDASDLGIRLRLLAEEIYSIGAAVEWLKRQTFAQTATGQELEYRAQERGLARKEAVPAQGTLTFSRDSAVWFDAPVESGIVCSTAGANPVQYVTTEAAVLKAGTLSVEVPARAMESGSAGNAAAGTVTVMVTVPTGIQSVKNAAAFTGGEDVESDDALRGRLLQSGIEAANGGNAAFYRDYALACDGVDSVSVVPRANGTGTVALYLGGKGCAPSSAIVNRVSENLNAMREICTQVTVKAAETVTVDVTATVRAATGLDSSEVTVACKQTIRDYFYGLGVSESFVPAALNSALFSTGMILDCTLGTGAVSVSQNQMAVCGTVSISVI